MNRHLYFREMKRYIDGAGSNKLNEVAEQHNKRVEEQMQLMCKSIGLLRSDFINVMRLKFDENDKLKNIEICLEELEEQIKELKEKLRKEKNVSWRIQNE